jgi:subtilase family serine protease
VIAATPATGAYVPVQVRDAYGVEDIYFNGTPGTGAGQTIAIIDAYNDPDIITDANTFSTDYGLPTFNSGGPTLQVLSETGTTTLPANSTPGQWDVEESLDVEWAHAIAPDANIILFEASSSSTTDLDTAIQTAAQTAGVSVVSMSYSTYEVLYYVSGIDESSTDSVYTTPAGHQGVTFLASTGDQASPALGYPAVSPNVVGVGGTSLLVGTDNSYISESAWSGGGGGLSLEESQPSYQSGEVNGVTSDVRSSPDVSMDADPETGVIVIDTYDSFFPIQVGGTSLSTPMWAGLIAIADQGLALRGQSSLNGVTQTLPMLYALPSSDFNDITTGDNGFPATTGYDLVTGLGTPIANLLIPALAGYPQTDVWTGAQNNDWFDANNWNTFSVPNATTDVVINFGTPVADAAIDIAGLTINGGILQIASGSGFSTVTSLNSSGTGTIDLTNNGLYINFGSAADPITTIAGYLTTGYSGGAWTGIGIDSSSAASNSAYALGYADGADGVVTGLTAGEIEIAYTLYGDANLDFSVNGADFTLMSNNFNDAVSGWDKGDFNYDGAVNGVDFVLMSANFNQNASQSAAEQNYSADIASSDDSNDAAILNSTSSTTAPVASAPASTPAAQTPSTTSAPAKHTPPKHHTKHKHA